MSQERGAATGGSHSRGKGCGQEFNHSNPLQPGLLLSKVLLYPKFLYLNDRMSMLEDSASYLYGTIYNLEAKVTNFDDNECIL